MKQYRLAILGATGAVGREMMKILQERRFPIQELRLLASEKSKGKKIEFAGEDLTVQAADNDSFDGMDMVLGAASSEMAKRFAPHIRRAGAVFVDNSSAFRLCPEVPLVIPEINPEDAKKHQGILSNPNCSTIIALMAVYPICRMSPVETMIASTYQAVSGAGAGGPLELEKQMEDIRQGREIQPQVFSDPIAYNVIPKIGSFEESGYTSEEMKMQNEGRKILHLENLKVNCTCVRVPVMRSHSISLALKTKDRLDLEEVKCAIAQSPGCRLVQGEGEYPMPNRVSDKNIVEVGRIRRDLTDERGISLWCCGDQIRKGAAFNAVQIAELLRENM